MIPHRPTLITGLSLVALVLCASAASALTFTCSSVARQDLFDPDNERFTNKFEHPDVSSTGAVVFSSRTRGGARKLYLYPPAGAGSVVAAEGGAAPGGSTFTRFETASINDDHDIGFHGHLASGKGVFVRPDGGALTSAARSGQASPGGGTFESFSAVSPVNDDGDIAFIAKVTGGPGGVFVYDLSADTLSAAALVGDPTGSGKTFCEFVNVTLGGGGRAAFLALTETTCGVSGDDVSGIFQEAVLGFTTVALEGGPTPIAGTTYAKLFDIDSNSADDVGFRAKLTGATNATAVFYFDRSGPTTTTLVRTGDAAPRSGGTLKTFPKMGGITNTQAVGIRAKIRNGTAKQGVFIFDGSDDAAVLDTDPVPSDLWGTTAAYRLINEETGVSSSGTWVTFSAKVKDQQTPSGTGLFRCHGV